MLCLRTVPYLDNHGSKVTDAAVNLLPLMMLPGQLGHSHSQQVVIKHLHLVSQVVCR